MRILCRAPASAATRAPGPTACLSAGCTPASAPAPDGGLLCTGVRVHVTHFRLPARSGLALAPVNNPECPGCLDNLCTLSLGWACRWIVSAASHDTWPALQQLFST